MPSDEKWIPSASFASLNHVNQTIHHHNRATKAASPPIIPAPTLAAFVGAALVGVEVVPEEVVLAAFASIEVPEVVLEPLLVIVAAALPVEVGVPVDAVAVEAHETAVGRPVT